MRANRIAKVSLEHNCFFDLTPERFLKEYCEVKNKICEWVFKNYERPVNYDHLCAIQEVLSDIKFKKVKFDDKELLKHWHENKAKVLHSKFKGRQAYCNYNLFGSVTGRLTLHKHSLPILNMKKEYRAAIKPNNDFFIELDYNAAEARVVLSLMGLEKFLDYFPNKLSGGMQRRVALARSFAVEPELLILDEPFVSLDEPAANLLRNMLLDLWSKQPTTVIFVTHNISEAIYLADKIIFLSKSPARVLKEVNINNTRPRNSNSESIQKIKKSILKSNSSILKGEI